MAKHEVLDPDRPGKRSGIRRLIYKPIRDSRPERKGRGNTAAGAWIDYQAQLIRTMRGAPEVVINVKGSSRTARGGKVTVDGVLRYMMYTSRSGQLPMVNEHGDQVVGKEEVSSVHATWDLDMQRVQSQKGELLHPSFNIIFSMPASTDPEKLLDAVSALARDRFVGHQYLMALHTPETDPADDPPAHPHVHLILRAEDGDGRRIHIRKNNLREWREQFAAELRARGVEANASSRAERGVSRKSLRGAEWHIQKRYQENMRNGTPGQPASATAARFLEAARDMTNGTPNEKPWEIAMAARRRNVLRELTRSETRLRKEGNVELADEVKQYMKNMAPLETERHQMQRAILKRVRERLQQSKKDEDAAREATQATRNRI